MARPRQRDDGAARGELAGSGGRYALSGDVGFADAARLLEEGDAAFGGEPAVEVDLSRVARFDSAGLALLLEWTISARAAGRSVRYRNIPPPVRSLAGMSDVTGLLEPSGGGG
jgi:phospholipid transport system transporter-binding protein